MRDNLTGETWRFSTHTNGKYLGEPEIVVTRGRAYQLPIDWAQDTWSSYWDGDCMVAVYDSRDYSSPTSGEDTDRAKYALRMAREYGQDVDAALTRLARRIEGNWAARFIPVPIDRGVTLYALSYDGDPEGTWADEIEAVSNGDVWRIETQTYEPGFGWDRGDWNPADDVCEEWYGEDVAQRDFERAFPLTAFPAELFIAEGVA